MKNRILYNWNLRRVVYVLLGLGVIIGSIVQKDWLTALLGGYFMSMGIFAFGCAGHNGCYVPTPNIKSLPKQQDLPEHK